MKFNASIEASLDLKEFGKVVTTLSKLSKLCVLHAKQDKLLFISRETLTNSSPTVWFEISRQSFFSTYVVKGINETNNEIILQFSPAQLARALLIKSDLIAVKLKLTNRHRPCLTVEIKTQSANAMQERESCHDIPVTIIPVRNWNDYSIPDTTNYDIKFNLPGLKTLKNLVEKMKKLSHFITFFCSAKGQLTLFVENEMTSLGGHYQDVIIKDVKVRDDEDLTQIESSCRIDSKSLLIFLNGSQFKNMEMIGTILYNDLIKIIIPIRLEVSLTCVIPAVND